MTDLHATERLLKALANGNRLRILKELKKKKSMTVTEVGKFLGMTIAAASKHLQVLENSGVIKRTKRGVYATHRIAFGGEEWVKKLLKKI